MWKSIALAAVTLLIFDGCAERIVTVQRPCPKLHPIHVKPIKGIRYEVR
jgi:hypothetical protein